MLSLYLLFSYQSQEIIAVCFSGFGIKKILFLEFISYIRRVMNNCLEKMFKRFVDDWYEDAELAYKLLGNRGLAEDFTHWLWLKNKESLVDIAIKYRRTITNGKNSNEILQEGK